MIEWSAAGRPLEGEVESGDRSFVKEGASGVLFAVIDGLGHGRSAAQAASVAAAALDESSGLPLPRVVEAVHARLKGTRGAVMTAAYIDEGHASLSFCGVGNVEGAVFHPSGGRESMVLHPGILGGETPRMNCRSLSLENDALVVLATDGVRGGWTSSVQPAQSVQSVAEAILQTCARASDDALVLALRWRGRR
jgi:phosphoserine phosphatase RsbX